MNDHHETATPECSDGEAGTTSSAGSEPEKAPRWSVLARTITENPHRVFIALALPFGLLIAAITPPFQPMDERSHFLRCYQVSMGELMPRQSGKSMGTDVPTSIENTAADYDRFYYRSNEKVKATDWWRHMGMPLEPEKTSFMPFTNTALYAPFMYIPQLLGVTIARSFNLPPIVILYMGRLTGLLGYVLLLALAIRIAPWGKWLFLTVALLPVALFTGSSVHADPMIIALTAMFLALCMRFSRGEGVLRFKQIALLTAIGTSIALCKVVYVPALLALFLIPRRRYGDRKTVIKYQLAFWGLSLGAFFLWSIFCLNTHTLEWEGVDAKAQISYILRHPVAFIQVLGNTLGEYDLHILLTMIGSMGHLDAVIPNFHFIAVMIVLPSVAACDEGVGELDLRRRLCLIMSAVTTLVLIMSAIYISAVPVGAPLVRGFNGRYLIPVLPPFMAAFNNRYFKVANPTPFRLFLVVFNVLSLSSAVYTLYARYYA